MDLSLSLIDERLTVSKLKEQICSAVEVEIQNQVTEYEISDEEHIALSHAAWSRFYSLVLQYHETGLVPMGLIVNDKSGLITIIKKNNFSFVRPVEALEHLVLNGGTNTSGAELFHDTPILCEDPLLGMISHKKSLITIFGHNHKIKNLIKKFDIIHKKSVSFIFGKFYLVFLKDSIFNLI